MKYEKIPQKLSSREGKIGLSTLQFINSEITLEMLEKYGINLEREEEENENFGNQLFFGKKPAQIWVNVDEINNLIDRLNREENQEVGNPPQNEDTPPKNEDKAKTKTENQKSNSNAESIRTLPVIDFNGRKKYFSEQFKRDVARFKKYADRKTGFSNLDELQNFMPGIYVLGGTPAVGKSDFTLQLMNQLADNGERCIYFSYEMDRATLYAREMARELFKADRHTTLTATEIKRGGTSITLEEIVGNAAKSNRKFDIIESGTLTVDDLIEVCKPVCNDTEKPPVIAVDYLQFMPPSRELKNSTDKMRVDDTVKKLKDFQRQTQCTMIIISSFNRDAYWQPAFFESFKESGGIEYTAETLWALQFNAVYEAGMMNTIMEKRIRISDAKREQPRKIELSCVKNRNGADGYICYFKYYSAHSYFEPCDESDFVRVKLPDLNQQKQSSKRRRNKYEDDDDEIDDEMRKGYD